MKPEPFTEDLVAAYYNVPERKQAKQNTFCDYNCLVKEGYSLDSKSRFYYSLPVASIIPHHCFRYVPPCGTLRRLIGNKKA